MITLVNEFYHEIQAVSPTFNQVNAYLLNTGWDINFNNDKVITYKYVGSNDKLKYCYNVFIYHHTLEGSIRDAIYYLSSLLNIPSYKVYLDMISYRF